MGILLVHGGYAKTHCGTNVISRTSSSWACILGNGEKQSKTQPPFMAGNCLKPRPRRRNNNSSVGDPSPFFSDDFLPHTLFSTYYAKK